MIFLERGQRQMIRLPAESRWKVLPGGMTMVALYSVMMAGPGYFLPGRRASREWICASCFLLSNMTGALGGESLPSFARPGRTNAFVATWFVMTSNGLDFRIARRRRVTSSTSRVGGWE